MVDTYEIQTEPTTVGAGGQRYRVWHHGEVLLECKDPLHDAAREFVAAGADMESRIVVFDMAGSEKGSARLGWAAGTRTSEGEAHGPRTSSWAPHPGIEKSE